MAWENMASSSVTWISVSLCVSGNKPVPDDSRDVGGEDYSLVCRASRQSKVSVLEWPVAQRQPPHLKSCKGFCFWDLEQVMGELCS